MVKNKKRIGIIIGLSITLYLVVMLTRMVHSIYIAPVCFTVSYFIFTLFALHFFRKRSGLSVTTIATAIIIGSVVLEIPVRIFDFKGTLFTLGSTFFTIIAIVLGSLSYVRKCVSVYILSIVILFILNIYVEGTWFKMCNKYLNIDYKEIIIF